MSDLLVVIAIVAVAAAWLGWRAWRFVRGKRTGCGCDHCPAMAKQPAPPPAKAIARQTPVQK